MNRHLCLALALISVSGSLAACESDESLPTRPRTGFLTPDAQAQQNAERKALEGPSRTRVPGGGPEFPGQQSASAAVPAENIVTLDAQATRPPTNPDFPIRDFTGPSGWDAWGHTYGPTTEYKRDMYKGVLPHLPVNPGTTPVAGSIMAPDGDWTIENSWGQGLVLENYPHRPWPKTTATYQSGITTHNPTYFFNLQDHTAIPQEGSQRRQDVQSALVEIPWFYLNTLATPIFMLLEPPLAVRTTERVSVDPTYQGNVPSGPVVPVPVAGTLRWDYPFMNPDGTIKAARDLPRTATQPAPQQ